MPRNAAAYDEDFYAWTQEQAQFVRAGQFPSLDIENLAEELESMGRSVRRELRNRLAILLMHLLKWEYQPGLQSRSWSGTIREQRRQIKDLLDESLSLMTVISADVAHAYGLATINAVAETGLLESAFPPTCPFTPEQILAEDFLPGE
ncbi:MAG TPA: DUF29 domain-containing protein [Stellaceae bacterium]|nr:DUF29 domain-containing protein [Stellaceae bacterium]